ncbi:MAG: NnrU family protein [Alphaproteobacteria bacterium]
MTGTLTGVALAAAVLILSHVGLSSPGLRGWLVARLGRPAFLALHSAVALATLAWLVVAYRAAPQVELWPAAPWTYLVPLALMPLAAVLLVAGMTTANATVTSDGKLPAGADPAPGILKVTRHPVMWAIILWAASHLPPNGDAASLIFFGTPTALALAGTALLDAKHAKTQGEAFARFAAVTSSVPLAATLRGRNRVRLSEIGLWKLAAGLALYAVFVLTHEFVIGTSPPPSCPRRLGGAGLVGGATSVPSWRA